jgi:PII-like signaling protein
MKGVCLRFYTHEHQKHHTGMLLYEWLLEFAKSNKIHGGSAFRGIAGFGRHGVLHEEHFFELASNVPIELLFIMSEKEADKFLNLLRDTEILDLLYVKTAIEYGALNDEQV